MTDRDHRTRTSPHTSVLFAGVDGRAHEKVVANAVQETGICSTVFLHTPDGETVNVEGYGDAIGHADIRLAMDTSTRRQHWASDELDVALGDLMNSNGAEHPFCSRALLRSVVADLRLEQLEVRAGFELEFYLLPFGRIPVSMPGSSHPRLWPRAFYGRSTTIEESLYAFLGSAERSGIPVHSMNREFEAFQVELATAPSDPLAAADHIFLLRELVRDVAATLNLRACFLPQPFTREHGSGLHLNLSVVSSDAKAGVLDEWASIILGQLPAAAAFFNSTINSYRRLMNSEFSTKVRGIASDRRDSLMRLVGESTERRIELRVPDPLTNPYAALTACLRLLQHSVGFRARASRVQEVGGRGSMQAAPELPTDLASALSNLTADDTLSAAYPVDFLRCYRAIKEHEISQASALVPHTDFLLYQPELLFSPRSETEGTSQ